MTELPGRGRSCHFVDVKDTFICPNFVVEFLVTDSVVQRLARVYLVGLGLLLLVHESSFGQMPFLLIQVAGRVYTQC